MKLKTCEISGGYLLFSMPLGDGECPCLYLALGARVR